MTTLEVLAPDGRRRVVDLPPEATILGTDTANAIVLTGDPTVSRVHARIERVGGAWVVEDLGSRNGTFVNGQRLAGRRVLRSGDELRVGAARLRLRDHATPNDGRTAPAVPPPQLTRREHDCLVALCRPVLAGSAFAEPASLKEIASALTVSESAVKKLLARLYDKFELLEDRRRGRLAAEAIARGAVDLNG